MQTPPSEIRLPEDSTHCGPDTRRIRLGPDSARGGLRRPQPAEDASCAALDPRGTRPGATEPVAARPAGGRLCSAVPRLGSGVEQGVHLGDLRLLGVDDLLGEGLGLGVAALG
ncbi:hypothetical protein GCM10010171_31610 [Actinokineospora fastidiosa]|uniref:Uncharacterized protein n=1 Tax=Actinokineospora fastidiosa TaxID=1816 RepID=A0A918LE75_9PSEU|nr:hypothetical protein GCM10010171_31610 [Actinokineospora fastidiosa]